MPQFQRLAQTCIYITLIFGQCVLGQVSRPRTFQQVLMESALEVNIKNRAFNDTSCKCISKDTTHSKPFLLHNIQSFRVELKTNQIREWIVHSEEHFSYLNFGSFANAIIRYPDRDHARIQQKYPKSMPFPCKNFTKHGIGRSLERPTSVHKLRPGDIDVIGALGDSLVAGNGAMEEFALGTMIENRGVSWCAGGEGTWREFLTLPNILKEFNRNLKGYSTGTGEFLSANAKLNVAFPVAADADALRQAKILVKKMKDDSTINLQEDWKMITLFFGANDICSAQCYNKEESSGRSHALKLMRALDYLYKNLPRTFVNLVPVLDVSISVRIKRTMMCRLFHTLFCVCFHRERNAMDTMTDLTKEYQKAEEELIFSGRYDKRDDFTVVIQPFIKIFNAPDDPARIFDEVLDISYITHDCFHFSQKGHAIGANMLWNNLFQPVGVKSERKLKYILEKFECQKPNAPYLFTYKNSRSYLSTGYQ